MTPPAGGPPRPARRGGLERQARLAVTLRSGAYPAWLDNDQCKAEGLL